jgi:hypothetical protein
MLGEGNRGERRQERGGGWLKGRYIREKVSVGDLSFLLCGLQRGPSSLHQCEIMKTNLLSQYVIELQVWGSTGV